MPRIEGRDIASIQWHQHRFGPTSAHIHDVGSVFQMSSLDAFLAEIQQGKLEVYCAFGDSTYNARYLQCIWSGFKSLVPGMNITTAQKMCNDRIKPHRQAIEWSYGDVDNIFQICSNVKSYRIGKMLPYANQQLCVCHLLSNCFTCINGNKALSYKKIKINPPLLEDYLQL